jgi:hypothetical protein
MTSRQFSTGEFLVYLLSVVMVWVTWWINVPGHVLVVPILVLVMSGPVGLAIGGRKWFLPATAVGFIFFVIQLLLPAINSAR